MRTMAKIVIVALMLCLPSTAMATSFSATWGLSEANPFNVVEFFLIPNGGTDPSFAGPADNFSDPSWGASIHNDQYFYATGGDLEKDPLDYYSLLFDVTFLDMYVPWKLYVLLWEDGNYYSGGTFVNGYEYEYAPPPLQSTGIGDPTILDNDTAMQTAQLGATPEPGTMLLFASAACAVGFFRRKMNKGRHIA
jgi:hypothetical protein